MYPPLNDILFLLLLSIFLIILYTKIIYSMDFSGLFKPKFSTYNRSQKINYYIKQINKKPIDLQKHIFKESLILITVLFIMYLLATKAIFFSTVISGSMNPTFDRDDLVLMQNIGHSYNVGDIIMFQRPDTSNPVSHRIVRIVNEVIYTKGDATSQIDWWEIKKEEILGKAILIQGKPIVIKEYGKFFIIDNKNQDFGPLGQDYRKYFLFFEVLKIYGYIIAVLSIFLYIIMTLKQKPWQSR